MRLRTLHSPVLLSLIVALALASRAGAQQTANDYVQPRVSRAQFAGLVQRLHLRKEQRDIAELTFDDYSATLNDLARRLDEEALGAGRKTVQDALAGKARISPEQLRQLRTAVLEVYKQAWPVADQAFDDLVHGIEALLNGEQAAVFDRALRQARREVLLHPRQNESHSQEYAGDGVDVLQLVDQARSEGGELAGVDPESLQMVLESYEIQLDGLLVESAAAHRLGKFMRDMAAIEANAMLRQEQEQAAIERWKHLYELNLATVQQIGQIAAGTVDEAGVERWQERFNRASFTWLYPRRKPDRQIEWIRQQSLADDKLKQSNAIYDRYVERRKSLSRGAIELMVRGRIELQSMLYAMMDPSTIGYDNRTRRELYEELVKNTGEQATLESEASTSLESLLSDSQRQALREAMKKPDTANRRR